MYLSGVSADTISTATNSRLPRTLSVFIDSPTQNSAVIDPREIFFTLLLSVQSRGGEEIWSNCLGYLKVALQPQVQCSPINVLLKFIFKISGLCWDGRSVASIPNKTSNNRATKHLNIRPSPKLRPSSLCKHYPLPKIMPVIEMEAARQTDVKGFFRCFLSATPPPTIAVKATAAACK